MYAMRPLAFKFEWNWPTLWPTFSKNLLKMRVFSWIEMLFFGEKCTV
jgi:hypothetical protein